MELEKGWPKTWEDVREAGVLPGVDAARYTQRYNQNNQENVQVWLLSMPAVLSPGLTAELHRRQFAGITPWAGTWAMQATIGEFLGSPQHRTTLELKMLEDQTRRLLKAIDPANLDHVARVAAFMHARFESIHPFPDGNGRVGRTLLTHFIRHTTARAGIKENGVRGIIKGHHPDKLAYVQAIIEARKSHNLAPLARHFQFELTGKAEDLSYLPSPFRIAPRSLAEESYAREFKEARRDVRGMHRRARPGCCRVPGCWMPEWKSLKRFVPPDAKAGRLLSRRLASSWRITPTNRSRLGKRSACSNRCRRSNPTGWACSGRDVGADPFARWAHQEVLGPLLRSLDADSSARLRTVIRAQTEGVGLADATDAALASARGAAFVPPAPPYLQVARETSHALPAPARSRPAPDKGQSLGRER